MIQIPPPVMQQARHILASPSAASSTSKAVQNRVMTAARGWLANCTDTALVEVIRAPMTHRNPDQLAIGMIRSAAIEVYALRHRVTRYDVVKVVGEMERGKQ